MSPDYRTVHALDEVTLRTVISKGRGECSARMTNWIVKHELRVTDHDFWAAVRHGAAPARPQAASGRPREELLPLSLVRALQAAGYTPGDLRGLTLDEAKRLLKPE